MNAFLNGVRAAASELRPLEAARARALHAATDLVRETKTFMQAVRTGEKESQARRRLEAAKGRLGSIIAKQPAIRNHGAIQQAMGEYAEALLFLHALRNRPSPGHKALGVTPQAYLLGLADLIGELRRESVTAMLHDQVEAAAISVDSMEKAYEALASISISDGVVSIRSKVDDARAIVERTRGDLLMAKRTKQLDKKIDGLSKLLDEAEGTQKKGKPKAASDDLDVDSAWHKSG